MSPHDQMEDTLTDAVFSALRYLPAGVLESWLLLVLPERFRTAAGDAARARFEFWPTLPGGSEPDVVVEVGGLLLVIEAKFGSAFGSWGRRHQLHEQWRQAARRAREEGLNGPVVIAVTRDLVEPIDITHVREVIATDDAFDGWGQADEAIRWCSWHRLAWCVEEAVPTLERTTRHLAEDLLADSLHRRRE
jgi:hypothetical protein